MPAGPAKFAAETRDALLAALREGPSDARSHPRRVRELLARLALDGMYQFVAVLAPDGTLLEANQPALEGGGLRRDDIVGRPFWDARWWTVSVEVQERLRAAIARARAGEFVRYEADVLAGRAGLDLVTIDFSLRPVADGDGAAAFLIAEGRNITEKRAAESELARRNAELRALYERVKELDAEKTRFFANVSHELRTPLALVLGPVERLLARPALDGALDGDARQALLVVERNARTLLKHVNDLLDAARIEAGRVRPSYARVDLARLVRLVASHFDALAADRRISLSVDAPPSFPAELDPRQLERVTVNLLSNAFKFTPDGGVVRVALSAAAGEARLEVADSGPGIPPEHREAVFERFRQLDGDAARRGGIGLGLAIAKDFVELHGGAISAGAAPEGGALLSVAVPLAGPPGRAAAAAADEPAPGAAAREALAALRTAPSPPVPDASPDRPLVLVVEDSVEMNAFLRAALAPEYRTAAAHDGAEGLQQALRLRPDLVLTDVMMPGASGDALLAGLRREPALAHVPVVLLTAKADDALRARLLEEGAQDYLSKPVSVPELRARVRNLVAVKRARDALQAELVGQAEDLGRMAEEVARRKRELSTALDAMRFAREQAERASAQKSSLMHLVSHELRTPLSALLLQLERLKRDAASLSARQRDSIGRMGGATMRLVDMVESLLEFSRIEAGRMALEPSPIDVPATAGEVLEDLRPHADQKGLALRVEVEGSLPPLVADARLVRLVLLNLVSNGLKFTDAGGVVVTLSQRAGRHRLAVRDSGRGISLEDQLKIFEPFEQLETLARKHTPGIGLGLTLVREMVQALGGELVLESAPGAGSTFTVTLPSAPPAPERDATGERPAGREDALRST